MPVLDCVFGVVGYVLTGIAFFRLSKLAGREDIAWFAWVPILSAILQLRLIHKSGWWILMYLVPIANIVFAIIWQVKLLHAYGKHGAWVLFAIFLNIVYYIMWVVWAYSDNTKYQLR
ncbi:DUF5684 domain-containing protein [Alicyclobacillus fastidiosus]|uniref:DUF5684 domain-containing protein n=1 Tax=Alicyclobacillus fastidiosus TaxID=392011 RepID=A0ABV5A9J5_9BACL|nr:DUF5684 domain-containing protein [Alicyclobacillus fastidiosus]WEH10874.1 DUF5684 domain-containing protein [Alicyclobacillus fastidiosus]